MIDGLSDGASRSECQLPARNCSPRLRCEGVLGRNCKEGVPKHRGMLRIPKESAVRVGADRSAQAGISDVGKSKVVWVCHHSTFQAEDIQTEDVNSFQSIFQCQQDVE